MNRKHGQSQRPQSYQSQSSMRSGRQGQSNSQYGRNFGSSVDTDYDYDMNTGSRSQRSLSADDSFETGRGFRDTDYDLDGSTYGSRSSANLGGRSSSSYSSDSSYGGEMGDYDTNERIRPSRFSADEDRFSSNRSSYDSSFGRYAGSQGDRGLNRQGSSSERFGYPSNMNAWSGNDRQFNSGRTTGRSQSSWAQDSDMDLSGSQNYGEGSLDRSSDRSSDWRASQSYGSNSSTSWDSQRGHFGKGPKGYKRSDDRIKEEVCETLARNPRIDASEVEVEVSDAVVTLSGTVESKDIRRAAEMAIENLSGVDDVKNEIRVKKADSFSTSTDSTFASSTASKNAKTSTKGSSHIS